MLHRLKSALNLAGNQLSTLPLMVLYLTDGCNSRCVTCDIWQNPRQNMPMSLAETLAQQAKQLGTQWVLMSGGEAMQHPEWPAIATLFRNHGVRVLLLTNGLFVHKQAQQIAEHVDELIVSLDGGTAKTYHDIRGVDAFDVVLKGIQAVRAFGVPVSTRTTVQRSNFREIPDIIQLGLEREVTVSFLAVDVSNRLAFGQRILTEQHSESPTALSLAETDELEIILNKVNNTFAEAFNKKQIAESPVKLRRILLDYFRALHGVGEFKSPRCNAPHFSTVIGVDGTLQPCYFLPSYGRLAPQGPALDNMLNVPQAKTLRDAYRNGERPECQLCVCPLYKSWRDLLQL